MGIQEGVSSGSPALVITGTNRADTIAITDNGSGAAGNVTVTLGDGSIYTSKTAVSMIEVFGKGGNDQVNYTLSGNLTSTRTVVVDLGAGNDQFTANVSGSVNTTDGLELQAYGDAGNDTMSVSQSGQILAGTFFPYLEGDAGNDALSFNGTGDISMGAAVTPGLSGGGGNDEISSSYSGKVVGNYIYELSADGGAGNDNITDSINLKSGSTGTVGTDSTMPAVVEGGTGNDQIRYSITVDPSDTLAQVNAVVIGGPGKDTVQQTSNVQVDKTSENDSVLTS